MPFIIRLHLQFVGSSVLVIALLSCGQPVRSTVKIHPNCPEIPATTFASVGLDANAGALKFGKFVTFGELSVKTDPALLSAISQTVRDDQITDALICAAKERGELKTEEQFDHAWKVARFYRTNPTSDMAIMFHKENPFPSASSSRGPGTSAKPEPLKPELAALTEINQRLGDGDRERLSNALFDFSTVLDQANRVFGEANREGAQLNQAWNKGHLANDLDMHRDKLRELLVSAKQYETDFLTSRRRWAYYDRHIRYIFGDDPDNHAAIIQNAVAEYLNQLDRWATIANKDGKSVQALLWPVQKEFDKDIRRFNEWRQSCIRRVEEMRYSIE